MARAAEHRYGRFATYYDYIYDELVDYAGDVDFLERIFRRFLRRRPKSVLDLGCGTGNHDIPLARRGYDVTGQDLSGPMLVLARRKARAARLPIRFVRGDMRAFDLHRSFDAAICMFGAFGYLVRLSDAVGCLRSVRRHLAPDGLFVFEFWQRSGAKPAPYQSWFHKVGPEFEIVRLSEARFVPRTGLLPIEFRFFVLRRGRVLDRFDERHTVQMHTVPGMRALLRRGGFDLVHASAVTNLKKGFRPVTKETFRVMAIARPRAQS